MKKFLALCLSVIMAGSLVACGAKDDSSANGDSKGPAQKKDVTLKVWGAQEEQELLKKLCDEFKAASTNVNYTIEFGVCSEADAKTKILEDTAAAADVFAFANDQLYDLVNAGALYEITKNKDAIVAANMQSVVDSASKDGSLYAYPMTADNGYFLYYDKSVITPEQAGSFETMLDAADAAGKKVVMDVSNGWYIASFFLGAGGKLAIGEDGKQTCDFNNEAGVGAGEGIKAITSHAAYMTGDDDVIKGGFGNSVVAAVSGAWNAKDIKEILGENYAAAKLPTFKVNGKDTQMGSFFGSKLVGVSAETKNPVEAMALAEYITNEKAQEARFAARGLGPSNKVVADSDVVKADLALKALADQSAFATSQNAVLGTYWGPAEAFGVAMETKDYSKSVKELLDAMVEQITK